MIDVSELLNPISQESECGESLVYDYTYDKIKEYMREDDPQLSQGVWQTDIKKADWNKAIDLTCDLLKTKTKDLQLLAWLTESLSAQYGLPGLINGIDATIEVAEKFWKNIYPLSDNENYRMMPFFYLEEKISKQIVQQPITDPLDNEIGAFTLSHWLTAEYNFKIKKRTGITINKIRKTLKATSIDFFKNQKEQVTNTISIINKLVEFLDKNVSVETPSFKSSLEYLKTIERINLQSVSEIKPVIEQKNIEKQDEIIEEPPKKEEIKQDVTDVMTIDTAYTSLEKISAFLEQQQPQSPASTLIKIAISIGHKSFQELLDINNKSNSAVINTIYELYKILQAPKKEEINNENELEENNENQ